MIGSFSIIASSDLARRRGFLDQRPALAPNFSSYACARSASEPRPLPLLASATSRVELLALLRRAPRARWPSSISSSLRKLPQPHVEDRLGLAVGQREFGDHHRLGLVLGADDLDHPVEVEEGDQVAVEQLEPVVDLADPVLGAADQHLDLERRARRAALP